jgi:hypothetical protein
MAVQNLAIFTVCSNNYVPLAKVLVQSVRAHHPNATFYLCVADKLLPDADFYPRDCEVIAATGLEIPEFKGFAFRYDVLEFNTAVKPYVLLLLLKRGHDAVLYFDPDIEVFTPLDGIIRKLDDGASFVLTPHLLRPAEGDCDPDDVGIMRAGIYNLGFLGVGATAEARAVLAWWARRLRYQCLSDQGGGLFVDQRFFDLVPGFADGVQILRETRYNVAYWNLAQRCLTQNGAGWLVDGQELGFFHFSGFDCANLGRLSKHSAAFRGNGIHTALLAIMRHYADRVMANGYHRARNIPYAYGRFASGAVISSDVRRLFRAQNGGWSGDPFTDFEDHVPMLDPAALPPLSADELTRQVRAIHASTSWRITSPLRAVGRLLKGERYSL